MLHKPSVCQKWMKFMAEIAAQWFDLAAADPAEGNDLQAPMVTLCIMGGKKTSCVQAIFWVR